jgi:GPH family glycoside/pentoside/hexuronide:cation symporter
MKSASEKLPFSLVIMFALGQLGWSLASFSVANLLTYFYMPPENSAGEGLFPSYIPQGAIWGSLTLLGLLAFSSRLFDAIKDPLIAHLSDRSESRLGRRRFFLMIGSTPLALFSALVFMPPHSSVSGINIAWLIATMLAFYISFSLYVTPFNALIAELGHTAEERLNISTWISVTWALGFALGNQVYGFQDLVATHWNLSKVDAFRSVITAFALLAWVLMLCPVVFIDERRYASVTASTEKIFDSLRATLRDHNFRLFLASDLFYWLSLTFIQLGMSYYILVLLEMEAAKLSLLMLLLFALSFVFYAPVNFLAKKFGKKPLVLAGFVLLAVVFSIASQLGRLPLDRNLQAYLLASIAALPLAIFGILPNAIIADLAGDAAVRTKSNRTAMYYGTRTLTMKLGISAANLIFPSFLLAGKGVGHDSGIRLTAYAAVIFGVLGLGFYMRVKENSQPSR